MVLTLLASTSDLLAAHPTIGCSTGYMDELRDDWAGLVEAAAQTSGFAIELSALSEDELEGLVAYLRARRRCRSGSSACTARRRTGACPTTSSSRCSSGCPRACRRSSCTRTRWSTSSPTGASAAGCASRTWTRASPSGQTAAELQRYFDALPEARFCFDIAHAKAVDPSLEVARELLSRFSLRLSHVHLSSLDAEQHHVPLTDEDQEAFAPVLKRCSDVPWILEAPPI